MIRSFRYESDHTNALNSHFVLFIVEPCFWVKGAVIITDIKISSSIHGCTT